MRERQLEAEMTLRVLEGEDYVLVTVDGAFDARTFRIPTTEATLFVGADTFDCRAIVFRSDRAGGRLRALYPLTGGELQARYDLREHCNDRSHQTVVTIEQVNEPMPDGKLKDQWTTVWEPTTDAGGDA